MEYKITLLAPNTWALDENGGVTLYLIAGEKSAVLLDTGFDGSALPETAASLTDRPVRLVHTHTHGDHTGGDAYWPEIWLHPAEFEDLKAQPGHENTVLHPLAEGDVLDLGGRELEIFHVPGHSPGSIALLDRKARLLFSGDTVMRQPVFLQNPNSSVSDFAESQKKLLALSDAFDLIWPCHDESPVGKQDILDLLASAEAALAGEPEEAIDVELATPEGWQTIHFKGYRRGRCGVITQAPPRP